MDAAEKEGHLNLIYIPGSRSKNSKIQVSRQTDRRVVECTRVAQCNRLDFVIASIQEGHPSVISQSSFYRMRSDSTHQSKDFINIYGNVSIRIRKAKSSFPLKSQAKKNPRRRSDQASSLVAVS